MTTSLSARQGLLTKTSGRLKTLLDEISETLRTRSSEDEEVKENGSSREEHDMQNRSLQLKKLKKAVETASTSVENALQTYTAAADMLDTSTPDLSAILDKVLSNSSVAQDLLLCAQTTMVELDMALEELPMVTSASQEEETTPVQLAPIPAPKFSGKIWEWESFWSAFEYSVHTRRIGDIYKMNYLLDSLEGEARQSLKQFQISGSTYTMAINHLKKKYGNPQLLLDELVGQLGNCRANSRRIEDQRILYEELSSILSQMSSKGECIDTALLQKQILSKFCERIQRHVLRKKHEQSGSERWTTSLLLSHVHDFINTEIEIQHNIEEPSQDQHMLRQDSMVRRITNTRNINERNHVCFFCRSSSHSPRDCTEYRTRQQRLDRMKRLSLCMNCGEANHMASTCTKGACRICHQRGHHTSICRQADPSTDKESTHFRKKVVTATQSHNPPPQRKTRQNFVSSTSNEDDDNNDDNVETVVCMKSTTTGATAKECVLVGEAQVFNAETQALETIHILLDTGADGSFIREDLARRLQLKNTDTLRMSVNTFGSQQSKELVCGITNLQLFDCSGQPHWFRVARIPHITEKLQRSHLTLEDKHYLAENHIKLSVSQNSPEVCPEVLLGCSDAFSLIDKQERQTSKTLPSGLRLIPSLLGYLITGPTNDYTPNTAVTKTTTSVTHDEHSRKWDEFLALQTSGIEEFVGTKTQEKEMENEKIWEKFKATIEHHADGYHVQLPWKEGATSLPDNRSIAYKRLCLNLTRLRSTPEILEQYHQTFKEQLNKGIIEEIDVHQPATGKIVHYLSHQAVIRPTKEFTKLRVVFDASAHLKGRPSLNDVLHQGPVILPLMRDLLLRFRLGNIAMIADVEKAFLQIHLKVEDRDATRCLWVRDPTIAPTASNLVEYRFTRVTFGLNCSPFLLAGTIKHHLQDNTCHKELAKEIHNNVYVDNVILTASNGKEALEKYKKSKAIFTEMNMNLRGYLTNNGDVNKNIPSHDRSMQCITKVLGILWDSAKDSITVDVHFAAHPVITKKIVSEHIASIYDPMGWLTPLMLKGKLFLQHLWIRGYDWNTELNKEDSMLWNKRIAQMQGFKQTNLSTSDFTSSVRCEACRICRC